MGERVGIQHHGLTFDLATLTLTNTNLVWAIWYGHWLGGVCVQRHGVTLS